MKKVRGIIIVWSLLLLWTPLVLADEAPSPYPTTLAEYIRLRNWLSAQQAKFITITNPTRVAMMKTAGLDVDPGFGYNTIVGPREGDYELLKQAYPRTIKATEDAWDSFLSMQDGGQSAASTALQSSPLPSLFDDLWKIIKEGGVRPIMGFELTGLEMAKRNIALDLIENHNFDQTTAEITADLFVRQQIKDVFPGALADFVTYIDRDYNYEKYAAEHKAIIEFWEKVFRKTRDDGHGAGSGGAGGGNDGGHGSGGGGSGGIPDDPCPKCHTTVIPFDGPCKVVLGLDGQYHLNCGPPKKKGN